MHAIHFVDDDELPEGQDFLLVALPEGGALIFYRESALSPAMLEDSWAAYRACPEGGSGTPTRVTWREVPPPLSLVSNA